MKKDFRIKNMSCDGKPIPDKYIACFNGYIEDVVNKAFAREQQLKQSQKELAIEKLEEVKKILSFDAYNITDNRFDCTRTIILWDDLNSIIDNQVKKLKGEIKNV